MKNSQEVETGAYAYFTKFLGGKQNRGVIGPTGESVHVGVGKEGRLSIVVLPSPVKAVQSLQFYRFAAALYPEKIMWAGRDGQLRDVPSGRVEFAGRVLMNCAEAIISRGQG